MAFRAKYNNSTSKLVVTWSEMEMESFYLCWSDTLTTDYTSLIQGGNYDIVYNNSGMWTDDDTPSGGSSRSYYAVNIYDYTLMALAIGIVPLEVITAPGDFTAEAVSASTVRCEFTLPDNIPSNALVSWQHTTDNPSGNNPVTWDTVLVTDIAGNQVIG